MRRELDDLLEDPGLEGAGEHRDVLDAFRIAAGDDAWIRRIRKGIERGMTAEVAARRVQTEARIRLRRAQSAYLRDRLADLDDLAGRLLRGLAQEHGGGTEAVGELPEGAVLFAHALGPAELLELDDALVTAAGLPAPVGDPIVHWSPGVEVRIVETRAGWVFVRLTDGREAWIPEQSIERV